MTPVGVFSFILFFASHFSGLHSTTNENRPTLPICIVGAGISGINLAILLQGKGYDVQLFEKCSKEGGKMDTFRIGDEVQVEMGALFHTTSYTSFQKYIDQFGLTSVRYDLSDRVAFDPQSGVLYPYPPPTAQDQEEITRYMHYRSQYTTEFDFGYLQATPDLFDPASTWVHNRNLTAFTPIIEFLITKFGYGSLDDTPALYVLKFVTVELLMAVLNISGSCFTLKEGLSTLVNKMASLVKNVHVNHELVALIRHHDHQVLLFKNNFSFQRKECRKTILAFAPIGLENIIFDLNSLERNVLDQVKIHKYTSAAHHLPTLTHNLYGTTVTLSANETLIEGDPIGSPLVGLAKQSLKKLQNVYSSYSWIRGNYNTKPSNQEMRQMSVKVEETLNKMVNDPKVLHRMKSTEYFPHVDTNSLKSGFYEDFNSIQGNKGLYYASTILTFEQMDEALKMTESFVERYFNQTIPITKV